MRYTYRDLVKAVEAVGGTLEDDGEHLTAGSTPGYVWTCNGCSCIVVPACHVDGRRDLVTACSTMAQDLQHGLQLATAEEAAEIMHLLDDEEWEAPTGAPAVISVL